VFASLFNYFLTRYSQSNSALTQKTRKKTLQLQQCFLVPVSFYGIYKNANGLQVKVRIQSMSKIDDVFGAKILHHLEGTSPDGFMIGIQEARV
jgi:hypothetical protein